MPQPQDWTDKKKREQLIKNMKKGQIQGPPTPQYAPVPGKESRSAIGLKGPVDSSTVEAAAIAALLKAAKGEGSPADVSRGTSTTVFSGEGPFPVGIEGPTDIQDQLLDEPSKVRMLAEAIAKGQRSPEQAFSDLLGEDKINFGKKDPVSVMKTLKAFDLVEEWRKQDPRYKKSFLESTVAPIVTGLGALTLNPFLLLAGGGLMSGAQKRQKELMAPVELARMEYIKDSIQGEFKQESPILATEKSRLKRDLMASLQDSVHRGKIKTKEELLVAARNSGVFEPSDLTTIGAMFETWRPTEEEIAQRKSQVTQEQTKSKALTQDTADALSKINTAITAEWKEKESPETVKVVDALKEGDVTAAAQEIHDKFKKYSGKAIIPWRQAIESGKIKNPFGIYLDPDTQEIILKPQKLTDVVQRFGEYDPSRRRVAYTNAVKATSEDLGIDSNDPEEVYKIVRLDTDEDEKIKDQYPILKDIDRDHGPLAYLINDFWAQIAENRKYRKQYNKGINLFMPKTYRVKHGYVTARPGISLPAIHYYGFENKYIVPVFKNPLPQNAGAQVIRARLDKMFEEVNKATDPVNREKAYLKYLTEDFYRRYYRPMLAALRE